MTKVTFKMHGPAFDDGMPLHLALASLQDVQAIFDKTYLVLSGARRLSRHNRHAFHLRAYEIKRGSLEADLQLVVQTAQYTIPVLSAISPSDIWAYTKQGFDFLKLIYALASEGRRPRYQINDNGTMNVYNGDDVTVFNGPVYMIGERALPHWRALNHRMREGEVHSYSMGASVAPEISLQESQKEIFDRPSIVDKDAREIVCDIFDFNKRANVGKLSVGEAGENLDVGDYPFSVVGSQDRIDYIASMARPAVRATVLREVEVDPFGEPKIVRLHVLEVRPNDLARSAQ